MSSNQSQLEKGAVVLLGLDIGRKRTGLALAKDGVAVEFATITDMDSLPHELQSICQSEGVGAVVIGLPLNEDHTETDQSAWVRQQAAMIEKEIHLPVQLEDEYLTSWEAERQLRALGLSDTQIKERIDARSAKILLEQYLSNSL